MRKTFTLRTDFTIKRNRLVEFLNSRSCSYFFPSTNLWWKFNFFHFKPKLFRPLFPTAKRRVLQKKTSFSSMCWEKQSVVRAFFSLYSIVDRSFHELLWRACLGRNVKLHGIFLLSIFMKAQKVFRPAKIEGMIFFCIILLILLWVCCLICCSNFSILTHKSIYNCVNMYLFYEHLAVPWLFYEFIDVNDCFIWISSILFLLFGRNFNTFINIFPRILHKII